MTSEKDQWLQQGAEEGYKYKFEESEDEESRYEENVYQEKYARDKDDDDYDESSCPNKGQCVSCLYTVSILGALTAIGAALYFFVMWMTTDEKFTTLTNGICNVTGYDYQDRK